MKVVTTAVHIHAEHTNAISNQIFDNRKNNITDNSRTEEQIMAFIDRVKEAGSKAAAGAKELGEVGVLKFKVEEAERKLRKVYEELGKSIFDEDQPEAKEKYGDMFEKIVEFKNELEDLNEQIKNVKAPK